MHRSRKVLSPFSVCVRRELNGHSTSQTLAHTFSSRAAFVFDLMDPSQSHAKVPVGYHAYRIRRPECIRVVYVRTYKQTNRLSVLLQLTRALSPTGRPCNVGTRRHRVSRCLKMFSARNSAENSFVTFYSFLEPSIDPLPPYFSRELSRGSRQGRGHRPHMLLPAGGSAGACRRCGMCRECMGCGREQNLKLRQSVMLVLGLGLECLV